MTATYGRSAEPKPPRHLVLVGMMGAGKSTVGRLLAERERRPFLDSDEMVEDRTGHTVREIFEMDGEAAFRRIEAEVLTDALASDRPAVIAAAGGVVLDPENRRRLRARSTVVWLRATAETLMARVPEGGHRPLLENDRAGTLTRLASQREALYREVAQLIVDVDGLAPEDIVDRIESSTS